MKSRNDGLQILELVKRIRAGKTLEAKEIAMLAEALNVEPEAVSEGLSETLESLPVAATDPDGNLDDDAKAKAEAAAEAPDAEAVEAVDPGSAEANADQGPEEADPDATDLELEEIYPKSLFLEYQKTLAQVGPRRA